MSRHNLRFIGGPLDGQFLPVADDEDIYRCMEQAPAPATPAEYERGVCDVAATVLTYERMDIFGAPSVMVLK